VQYLPNLIRSFSNYQNEYLTTAINHEYSNENDLIESITKQLNYEPLAGDQVEVFKQFDVLLAEYNLTAQSIN